MCCGLKPFNAVTSFCCGGLPIKIPCLESSCDVQPPAFDPDTQVCLNGEKITVAAHCCDGEVQYFCCGGVIRDVPLNDCVRDSLYKDEVCCGDMRISAEFVSCCAEKIPYSRLTEQCCGTFVAPMTGYKRDSSSYPDSAPELMDMDKQTCIGGHVIPRNSWENDSIGYCCGAEIVPRLLPPTTAPKPLPRCGEKTYDDSKFMCCNRYAYPANVYLCCEGQVQGKPEEAACCGQFAYSRLGHRCERDVVVPL
ncbi:hypothetical protein NP493_364g04076 [Ridgeia piscesae]|uniref:Galaxin-like repeats domain-containing protein n=1 Tax=Ridgeia piscesae TaxID=27915 RepID=A0AAD9L2J1_RIDPI|nr:hypothetical protein NP493_364g04076 [Ridgeia piscesae]